MGLVVRGLIKRGGVWWVRVAVPADVRSLLGKTELLESLGTGDDAEAVRLGTPVIVQFKRQIADARGCVYTPPKADDRLTPAIALSRLEAWERREIREAEANAFNEPPPGIDWYGAHLRSELMYALGQRDASVLRRSHARAAAEIAAIYAAAANDPEALARLNDARF